jgi:hypothetical protein
VRVTWLLQSIVLLLNHTPLKHVFDRIYDLGVRRIVAALSSHPAVVCLLGSGSYFEKRTVPGLSDVDLIIVLNEKVTRADAATDEIANTYERVRRIFPFLGRWQEKQANLIYLSDIAAGFPAPESFRTRFKLGRLVTLYGELPGDIVSGPITTSELITEINTLLRFSLIADSRPVRRLVFWKRIFTRLSGLADLLDLTDWSRQMRKRAELAFLTEGDTQLFFRKADPTQMFSLLLALTRQIFDAVAVRELKQRIQPIVRTAHAVPRPAPIPFSSALDPPNDHRLSIRTTHSVPIGLTPRLLYFSVDERIPVFEIREAAYDGLQRLRRAKPRQSVTDENALVSADGFLFIATRQSSFVDLIPLDPLQFANVYAAVFDNSLEFEMPANILAEQYATAAAMFRGFAHLYRVNEAAITKLPFPCIYREHDAELIESALRLLRVYFACTEGTLVQSLSDLFAYLRHRYPECEDFLIKLECYRRFLYGDLPPGESVPNNIYRCLQQFMGQVLAGSDSITIDSPQKHLGITVGVITRNRAANLEQMLDSLTRQVRAPDEVLVVDNGSTDNTQAVLERFSDRLPVRRQFLERANIPGARNLAIESAANEIVSFVDDDCITEPDWLIAVETGFLRADNIGIVGGWVTHEPAPRNSVVENFYRVFHHVKS